MPFKIFYQVCKFPNENIRNRYMVRKFIYDQNSKKYIKHEKYIYGERNLNKLNSEINKMNYQYEYIQSSSFDNIPYPLLN